MADATATAFGGHMRSQHRAGTVSRGCWRLVVLLGLSWVAIMLLGGTAQAADDAPRRDQATAPAATPAGLPLVGQALAGVGTVTDALPLTKVTDVTEVATQTLQVLAPREVAVVPEPVAEVVGAATVVSASVRATAEATSASDAVLDVRLPSVGATADPVVRSVATQLDTTARAAVDTVAVLTSPVPLARPLTGVLDAAAGSLDASTDLLVAAGTGMTRAVDSLVTTTADILTPLLRTIAGPTGSIVVSGPCAGGGAGAITVPASMPAGISAGQPAALATGALTSAARQTADLLRDGTSGPAVPPPDATDSVDLEAQPASDIVTSLAVPVSGAGSTTGGAAPTPSLDQTLVRVDESDPVFEANVTEPIEGPAGPMPGTPCFDPAFSPD